MSTGTFAPRPGSAPLARQVLAQARMETVLLLRNGEQLLLALVIPVLVLTGGVLAARQLDLSLSYTAIDELTPGVLALAIMSTAFTSLAIATGFERRYGVLKRLGASPLPRHGLLLGKVLALLLVEAVQVLVLSAVALGLGWDPATTVRALAGALAMIVLGTATFASLGLLIAGSLRAEATLAAANLVYILLAAGGGVVLPLSTYGGFGEVLAYLPSGALGSGMRESLVHGTFPLDQSLVLLVWTVVGDRADGQDVQVGVDVTSPLSARLVVRRRRGCGGRDRLARRQRRDRRHRRRGAADRLRAGLPDLAALHRGVVPPARRMTIHAAIEFGNRMVTFLIAAVAIATLVAVWRVGRDDLRVPAVVLAVGVPAQAVARRGHGADRPEPLDGGAAPDRVDGHDLRRGAAGALGAALDRVPAARDRPDRSPPAGDRRRAALGRGVRRPAGRCSTSARW